VETGDIFFFCRPRVDAGKADDPQDVQRVYLRSPRISGQSRGSPSGCTTPTSATRALRLARAAWRRLGGRALARV